MGKLGKPLHYKGSGFHRVIPQFMLQVRREGAGAVGEGVELLRPRRPLSADLTPPLLRRAVTSLAATCVHLVGWEGCSFISSDRKCSACSLFQHAALLRLNSHFHSLQGTGGESIYGEKVRRRSRSAPAVHRWARARTPRAPHPAPTRSACAVCGREVH